MERDSTYSTAERSAMLVALGKEFYDHPGWDDAIKYQEQGDAREHEVMTKVWSETIDRLTADPVRLRNYLELLIELSRDEYDRLNP